MHRIDIADIEYLFWCLSRQFYYTPVELRYWGIQTWIGKVLPPFHSPFPHPPGLTNPVSRDERQPQVGASSKEKA